MACNVAPCARRLMASFPRRELATSLRELRRARRLVVNDPEIMGGDPVFRGTRVPVHMIGELVAQGSTQAELLEGYPRLTAEMIRLAPVYAAAYPLRGRPRNQPWRDQKPVHRARRRVDTHRGVVPARGYNDVGSR
jgi:uncharacterized protein (DUF433 family)